ncbi:hypothetical protein LINPERPRIM_LOCUS37640 [Linum perenne]
MRIARSESYTGTSRPVTFC